MNNLFRFTIYVLLFVVTLFMAGTNIAQTPGSITFKVTTSRTYASFDQKNIIVGWFVYTNPETCSIEIRNE